MMNSRGRGIVTWMALAGAVACGSGAAEPAASGPQGARPTSVASPAPGGVLTPEGTVSGTTPGVQTPAYEGGRILNGEIYVVPIFYGTAWQTNYQADILAFLGTISSSSYWQVVQSYSDSWGDHAGAISVLPAVYDTGYSQGKTLYPSNVAAIVQTDGVPTTSNPSSQTIYAVFTADDVNQYNTPTGQSGGLCTDWLGWHGYQEFTYSNPNFVQTPFTTEYVWVGSPQYCVNNSLPGIASAWSKSPNGPVIDESLSDTMHELAESATDPYIGTGWAPEIGDICAWIPGPVVPDDFCITVEGRRHCTTLFDYDLGSGAPYSSTQKGYHDNLGANYMVQTIWDPKQNGCAYGPASLDAVCPTQAAACGTARCGIVSNQCGGTFSCGDCTELQYCFEGACRSRVVIGG